MRAVGIILAGGNGKKMKQLSEKRAVAAMPIAGSYRSIDFVLSNMSNSHIQNGGILVENKVDYMYLIQLLHMIIIVGIEEQQML